MAGKYDRWISTWAAVWLALSPACIPTQEQPQEKNAPAPIVRRLSEQQFGIQVSGLEVIQSSLSEKQHVGDLLSAHNVTPAMIEAIAQESRTVFDVRKMKAGAPITILKDGQEGVKYFIYEKSKSELVVFELSSPLKVYETHIPVSYRMRELSGVVSSSLNESIELHGGNQTLALALEKVFGWTIDFQKLRSGDTYKILYEEALVNGQAAGFHRIYAAVIHHQGRDFPAFYFKSNHTNGYFDENGNSLRRQFLKSPVKSSHTPPSLVRPSKPEKGYRYQVTSGSPVWTLAEGEVKEIKKQGGAYRLGISHPEGIVTVFEGLSPQPGLRAGSRVKQGQPIGSIAKTQKSAKPLLRVYYYQNGIAIPPTDLPDLPAERIADEDKTAFSKLKTEALSRLNRMRINQVQTGIGF